MIDADAQGSLTASLGWRQPDQLEVTLATIMGKVLSDAPIATLESIVEKVIHQLFDRVKTVATKWLRPQNKGFPNIRKKPVNPDGY